MLSRDKLAREFATMEEAYDAGFADGRADFNRLAYSLRDAAEMLSIGLSLLKEEVYAGRIESVKMGTRTLIPRWALEERLKPESSPVDALLAQEGLG